LYRPFASPWTYVGEAPSATTADGQLTLDEATRYGLDAAVELRPLFLVGGAHVADSPGPAAHNRLFRQRGLPWTYLPLPAGDFANALTLIRRLGFVGASVTMPHKRRAAALADRLEGPAARWQVVNTLYHTAAGELVGVNTDGDAIADALGGPTSVAGKRAVVVGAGGAATAAARQLGEGGAHVTICARNGAAARELAGSVNGRWIGFRDFLEMDFDFLINTVPADALADLIGERPRRWSGRTVVDLAIREAAGPLAALARASGATYVRGLDVWCSQAARQQVLWTGLPTTADDLCAALREEGWNADD
jgi:shikimate dehydrogenase